jgi:hypothetical protein
MAFHAITLTCLLLIQAATAFIHLLQSTMSGKKKTIQRESSQSNAFSVTCDIPHTSEQHTLKH